MDNDQPPDPSSNNAYDEAQREAEPAHILNPGIGYVRAWARAARAAAALETELRACRLDDVLPYMRAEVNVFGVGIIEVGRITPDTAYALAALLAKARTISTAKEDTHRGSAA